MEKEKNKKIELAKKIVHRVAEVIIIAVGWIFIFIGVAGIILPIVPGWLLIILGLTMIGSPLVHKVVKEIKRRKEIARRGVKKLFKQ